MWLLFLKVMLWIRCLNAKRVERFSELFGADFRVMPWDLDENKHMNNSRYLNYFEATRYVCVFRSAFFKTLVQKQWGTPIGSYRIQFMRSLKLGMKFHVTGQIVYWDDRSFVFEHKIFARKTKGGEPKLMARAYMRQFVRSGRNIINPVEMIRALGLPEEPSPPMTEELRLWEELDKARPS
jgi:YbgC/YbaW family acyl-CoA thioester hydrolase